MNNEDNSNDPIIYIRRQWNDWRIARVNLSNLSVLNWDNYSGGVGQRSPQFFIHGFVRCNEIVGDIAHSCSHVPPPHSIKVCVVKKDNKPEVFKMLLDIVGPKPKK